MPTIQIDNASLEYEEKGRSEPLVLVHGSASDYRTWHNQMDVFSREYRTIRYSRRYHWPNDPIPPESDYPMAEQVDDLEELLHKLKASPAHLVGHSYGGFLCLLLAIRAPGLVRSLVLIEPPVLTLYVSNEPKLSELLPLFFRRPRTALAILKFGAKGFAPAAKAAEKDDMEEANRIFGKAVLGEEFYENLSDARREQIFDNAIKAEFLGSGFPPLQADSIRKVDIPTLLVDGEHSPNFFHRLNDGLEELMPRTERLVVPGASHIVQEDNPEAFNEAVLDFLHSQ